MAIAYSGHQRDDDVVRVCTVATGAWDGYWGAQTRCTWLGFDIIPQTATETAMLPKELTNATVNQLTVGQQAAVRAIVCDGPGDIEQKVFYGENWATRVPAWQQAGTFFNTATPKGRLEVSETKAGQGFGVRVGLQSQTGRIEISELLASNGDWSTTVSAIEVHVSVASTTAGVTHPFTLYPTSGKVAWATGDATTPSAVYLTWPTKDTDTECSIDSEFEVTLSASSRSAPGLVDYHLSTLKIRVWDEDRFGVLDWTALTLNTSTGAYGEVEIGNDVVKDVENAKWRGNITTGAEQFLSFGAAVNNSMGSVLRRQCSTSDKQIGVMHHGMKAMNVILQVSAKAHEQTEYAVVACRPLPGDAILLNYTAVEYAEYCKVIASKAGEYSVNFEEGDCDEEQIKIVAIVALVPLACQNGESPVISCKSFLLNRLIN